MKIKSILRNMLNIKLKNRKNINHYCVSKIELTINVVTLKCPIINYSPNRLLNKKLMLIHLAKSHNI